MILKEHSKQQCEAIVRWVGKQQERFDELVQLFLNDEDLVKQRAGWPLAYIAEAHPAMMDVHLKAIVANLQKKGLHNSVKRNTIRLLQTVPIPEKLQGEVMDICFRFIEAPGEAVAVKAFSITVLQKLALIYPEILPEIKYLLESESLQASPAIRVRMRRLLHEGENPPKSKMKKRI